MQTEDNDLEGLYDQDEAVRYIKENLPANFVNEITDEEINFVLDMEDAYFESKGYFDENAPETVELDDDEEYNFICDRAEKNPQFSRLSSNAINVILDKNYDFCVEKGIFDDEDEA